MLYEEEIKKGILIRIFEQRLLSLFTEGLINGTVHTAVGQEFTGIFISKYLNSDDFITSNHRGHGHYLARFNNAKGLLSEIMGSADGLSGGHGGSQHIADHNYLSNGIQGGMVPIAAGVSYFYKLNKQPNIAVSYIGDGTLGEGILYETMNISSIYNLPLLIVIENNGYAQSTSIKETLGGNIKDRVLGFGLSYFNSSTFDIGDLDSTCKEAINFVRTNGCPAVIEIETYRLNSHSKGDDNRNKEEIEHYRKNDYLSFIIENETSLSDYIQETEQYIDSIINEIKKTKKIPSLIKTPRLSEIVRENDTSPEITKHGKYNHLIYEALVNVFKKSNDTILIGEDIQNKSQFTHTNYGGAFKCTKDLSDLFPNRVFNTPISEAAIYGFVSGYSIKAGRSFVEIMFGDFTSLIFDQILQHSSKFERMFNGKITCPVTVRTPMGGKRGYGPTHSQSIEKHFLGIDNFSIIALNHRISPYYVYNSLMKTNNPSMIIENKTLYSIDTSKKKLPTYSYEFNESLFPDLIIRPTNTESNATILCYGEMLNEVEDAVNDLLINEEYFFDIIAPSLISEINLDSIIPSLKRTRKLVIIEEGPGFSSWGSEIVSMLHESGFTNFDLIRIYNKDVISSNVETELSLIPHRQTIYNRIHKFISYANN
jgi:2-oxoisovalerate dehydrogenase E1 component